MPASDSAKITKRIEELGDWRGEALARIRQLIHDADPDIQEEWKWQKQKSSGTPVWSHDGGVCTGESYKQVVKLTFFRGASIEDPKQLFNSSLEGNVSRAIDLHASSLILVHNHPSGDPSPSRQDIAVTRDIVEAGKRLGIQVHDHVIIGADGHSSMRAMGLL